jgi:hypothetical protein
LHPTLPAFKAATERLIRRFESDHDHYLSKGYSEAQARVDFITPLFKALGWDVENEAGLPHHSREVLVEAAEDTGGRPDYSFRIAGQTRFFVEAKRPSFPTHPYRRIRPESRKHSDQAPRRAGPTHVPKNCVEIRPCAPGAQPNLMRPLYPLPSLQSLPFRWPQAIGARHRLSQPLPLTPERSSF